MNRTKVKIIIFFVFSSLQTYCSQDIDYQHKSVYKEIEKTGDINNPSLIELKVPDSIITEEHLKGKYFQIKTEPIQSQINYVFIGRVSCCRAGGCSSIPEHIDEQNPEYFDYFILLDKQSRVKKVKVYNYQATHGHEVSSSGWLKQFIGYDGTNSLEVGNDIDAISGATVSVYALTYDVQIKTEILKKVLNL